MNTNGPTTSLLPDNPVSRHISLAKRVTAAERWHLLSCIGAVLAAVLATIPVLEMGVNDDWSYTKTALDLANTGHLIYNGWATAMIGAQAYWAALWIKLFGFSFTLVRLTTLPLAAGCAGLLYGLGRRAGLSMSLAAFACLSVTLSPVFIPLAASFMTDVPGLFLFLLSLYLFVRAIEEDKKQTQVIWLTAATIAAAIGGTVRQVDWIAPVVFLPYLARLRGSARNFSAACWLLWGANLIFAVWCLHWYREQPYAIVERPTEGAQNFLLKMPYSLTAFRPLVLTTVLLTLPVWTGTCRLWFPAARRNPYLFLTCPAAVVLLGYLIPHLHHEQATMPWMGDIITRQGELGSWVTLFGELPETLPQIVRILTSVMVYGVIGVLCAVLLQVVQDWLLSPTRRPTLPSLPLVDRLWLLYSVCYAPLLAIRSYTDGTFDRYLIFILPAVIFPVLRYFQDNVCPVMTVWGYLVLALFALYGIATTHDYIARGRARLAAAAELTAAGIPRTRINAGLEYDAWTQIEQTGYFNDSRIMVPSHAAITVPKRRWPLTHSYLFCSYTPSLIYDYFVIFSPQPQMQRTEYGPVPYTTWLPPGVRYASVVKNPIPADQELR